jgi:hypothetical protein
MVSLPFSAPTHMLLSTQEASHSYNMDNPAIIFSHLHNTATSSPGGGGRCTTAGELEAVWPRNCGSHPPPPSSVCKRETILEEPPGHSAWQKSEEHLGGSRASAAWGQQLVIHWQ